MKRNRQQFRPLLDEGNKNETRPSLRVVLVVISACLIGITGIAFMTPRPWGIIFGPLMADLTSKCILLGYLMYREGLTHRFPLPRFTTGLFVTALSAAWCLSARAPDGLLVLAGWTTIQVLYYVGKHRSSLSAAYLRGYATYMLASCVIPTIIIWCIYAHTK